MFNLKLKDRQRLQPYPASSVVRSSVSPVEQRGWPEILLGAVVEAMKTQFIWKSARNKQSPTTELYQFQWILQWFLMFVSSRITLNRFLRHLALIRCRNLQEARVVGNIRWLTCIRCDGYVRFAERWCGPSLNDGLSMKTPWKYDETWKQFVFGCQTPILFLTRKNHNRLIYFRVLTSPTEVTPRSQLRSWLTQRIHAVPPHGCSSWWNLKQQSCRSQPNSNDLRNERCRLRFRNFRTQGGCVDLSSIFHHVLFTSNTWPVPTLMDG